MWLNCAIKECYRALEACEPEPVLRAGIYVRQLARSAMAQCETCGNDYDKAFQVVINGVTHTFDSFECAIQRVAPTCPNCGVHILGHGVEKEGTVFCCAHCAKAEGVTELRDRA
jgi:hypothetical protein